MMTEQPVQRDSRRGCIKLLLAALILPANLWLTGRAFAANWMRSAFEAKKTAEVLSALQVAQVTPQADIVIEAPQKAENGAVVQVDIAAPGVAGSVRSLRLLADANPTPLVVSVVLGKQVLPRLVTRIKMAQSGDLIALVEKPGLANSSGTAHGASFSEQRRPVIVLEDGCASNEREEPFASSMKLRARLLQEDTAEHGVGKDTVELKIIILHPMRTGRGKGDDGQVLPAHFMQQMQVLLNGELVVDAQTGTAISRNPYFTFYLTQARVGDTVAVRWQDNRGYSGQAETTVNV